MPRYLHISWRDLIRRLPPLAALALFLAAAGPAAPATASPATGSPTAGSPAAGGRAAGGPDEVQGGIQAAPPEGGSDPVVASVEGDLIHLSDLRSAEQSLPENLRNMPFEALYPILLNRMVDQAALLMAARRQGLERDPAVQQQIRAATEQVLENALLARDAAPTVTEAAIATRYHKLYGTGTGGIEEVHARHILVRTKAEADKLIAALKGGADFATLAKKYSEDPDAQKGGDLGFFSRNQVEPGFANVVFSLPPGQVTTIHNEFGWHVMQVLERRDVAAPSLAEVHDAIRAQLLKEAVRQEVASARGEFVIHEWNLNGSPIGPGEAAGNEPAKAK